MPIPVKIESKELLVVEDLKTYFPVRVWGFTACGSQC